MNEHNEIKKSGLSIPVDMKNTELFKVIIHNITEIFNDKRIDSALLDKHYNGLLDAYTKLNENRNSILGKKIETAIANLDFILKDKKMCSKCRREYELLSYAFRSIRILLFEKDNSSVSFENLLNAQYELDRYIYFKNNANTSKLVEDTFLALIVEVSELANTTRCFKHWSNKGADPKEEQLKEYVDVLHFFLSLGNQLGFSSEEVTNAYIEKYMLNITRQNTGY